MESDPVYSLFWEILKIGLIDENDKIQCPGTVKHVQVHTTESYLHQCETFEEIYFEIKSNQSI